ncbi:MAG: fatty acid desaturase, partial [Myxococcales bacterium]|nr:fatty acid desaturase [Myxococcales bacterium]
HHGCNRRDARTSALDTFVFRSDGPLQRAWAWAAWLLAVLAGGWFWHSVVSILLFLGLPVSLARRISPAFHGWSTRDRLASLAVFAVAVGIQVGLATLGVWTVVFAVPIAVFAWVYSVQLYVYHYATTLGPEVTLHARRLHGPGVSWWLLNLNEHDTHHREPRLVWYALPTRGRALPEGFEGNQRHTSFVRGLLDQLRGPTVIVEDP